MTSPAQPRYRFIDLAKASGPKLTDRMVAAAERVIRSGRFLHGEHTDRFEREIARICHTGHCVAVSNGLDAIRLIFRAYLEMGRLHPGDEVIVPGNTFIASVLPLTELGLVPLIADPSEEDFNLSLAEVEKLLTPKTKAILTVHLYGTPSWDAAAARRLHERGILLIEDNAQAIGAVAAEEGLHGSHVTASLGDAAAISFYPTKNLGALGDAGAVLTSDQKLADTVRVLANYGADRRYHNLLCGYNNRIDEIQAAMMLEKIPLLDDVADRRALTAETYSRCISNPLVTTPRIFPDRRQVWHQYVVRSPRRDDLKQFLADHGVETDIHYLVPPHEQPCYKGRLPLSRPLPVTEKLAAEVLSLPIVNATPRDAEEIASIINRFK